MSQSWWKSRKTEQIFTVVVVCTFVAAAVWPCCSALLFPLPGMRALSVADDFSRTLQALTVLLAGLSLAVDRWQTPDRLLMFEGMAVLLWLQGFLYIGVPYAMTFAWFAVAARGRRKSMQQ